MAMATQADIFDLRLRIKNPLGVIAILAVANEDALDDIESPARQTAYLQQDTGVYYTYDPDLEEWEAKDLLLSDATIGTLIDAYGAAAAVPKAIKNIMAELGQRLTIASTKGGDGSTDYQNLATMYRFYKDLVATMEEEIAVDAGTSQGRYLRIRRPSIAGGMLG
jgi:hypothetical protein